MLTGFRLSVSDEGGEKTQPNFAINFVEVNSWRFPGLKLALRYAFKTRLGLDASTTYQKCAGNHYK